MREPTSHRVLACWAPAAAILLLSLGFWGCGAHADTNEDVLSLMQADRSRARSLLRTDAAAFGTHYTDDAVVYFPEAPAAIGRRAVQELLSGQRSEKGFRMAEQVEDARVAASGELGYTSGAFVLSRRVTGDRGRPKRVELGGNYVAVWRRGEDGSWKCVMHTSNYRPDWASTSLTSL
ncbi:MAG: DUF4440 domain-containing protein [Thermoanaerobaculia bacterium]|nr:DUF4440 domain-containing protein [Thermoanaerobaculia bacterium]